jgi:hypothetical protein
MGCFGILMERCIRWIPKKSGVDLERVELTTDRDLHVVTGINQLLESQVRFPTKMNGLVDTVHVIHYIMFCV